MVSAASRLKHVGAPLSLPGDDAGVLNRGSVWVVVPAYNEELSIGIVTAALRSEGYQVVVVDDGSTDRTANVARQAGARVLRHCQNLGQGGALQTGITFSVRAGAEFICTFDADGQHCVEDVQRMWTFLMTQNLDVVLGSRFLGRSPGIPLSRKFLLKAAVLFTWIHSGVWLTDAHDGLRLLRAEAASKLALTQLGMAHASEIITQIAKLRLRYREFPVTVLYTKYSKSKGQVASGCIEIIMDLFIGRMMRQRH